MEGVGDHIFGIAPLMAGCMNGAGGTVDGFVDPRENLPEDLDVRYSILPYEILSDIYHRY